MICSPNISRSSVLAIAILATAMLSVAASAHTVTTNFRFHITDTNDEIHVNGTNYGGQSVSLNFPNPSAPYISSGRGGTLLALVAVSPPARIILNTQADPYLFALEQDESSQVIIIGLTNGSWSDIESKAFGKIPPTFFGNLNTLSFTSGLALQLPFTGINVNGVIGPGPIITRSVGRDRLPIVELKVAGY